MRIRIWVPIVLSIVLIGAVVFGSGLRLTTVDAKREAEQQREDLIQLRYDYKLLKAELRDLNERHDDLLDLFEQRATDSSEPSSSSGTGGFIRVPGYSSGSSDNDDDGDDETRIIERNNSTTVPSSGNNDDSDDGEDAPPVVDVPELPKLPELPDVNKTKDDLLKGTPLEGLL